jgi:phage gp45-like
VYEDLNLIVRASAHAQKKQISNKQKRNRKETERKKQYGIESRNKFTKHTGCGRWSYVTYGGKGSKLITYVSVYRVCNQTNPGDTTTWRQKYQIQYADESARVGSIVPHRKTMVNLEYFVRELRDEGHAVVVFMDANQNESRCYRPQTQDWKFKSDTGFNINGNSDGSLKTFVQNLGLHNILNTKHGDENGPPSRYPGLSVIDYVYVSEGLLKHVIGIGMLDFDAVFDSDFGHSFSISILSLSLVQS